MLLSIIIVSWNCYDYLQKCIASIYRQTQGLEFEIIVVDNASADNTAQRIAAVFPQVKVIQSGGNLGFSRANNLGFAQAAGKYLLFLNPDTQIVDNALFTMVTRFSTLKNAGAAGCRLVNSDLSLQTSSVLPIPTILNQILTVEFLRLAVPHSNLWGTRALFNGERVPQEVEALSGACLMVKREAFEAAGKFNTDYFMYSDDVDLCYSVRQKGYGVYYIGEATVIHHGGKSTNKSGPGNLSVLMMKESTFIFLKKSRGAGYARLYKTCFLGASAARLAVLALVLPLFFIAGKYDSVKHSLRKWVTIFEWSSGLEQCPKLP
ncbi:MAG: glycosyltransferase family 2 protein [Chitinivibrionales bacterium]|nr:glycosyltransferase family 2 protein [Chitinivibrionales bacterium]